MNMVITKKYMQKIALAVLLAAAGMLAALPVGAAVKPGAKYVGGNLTLEAKGATGRSPGNHCQDCRYRCLCGPRFSGCG